jgi:predicted regulator of Ras-like GTPase activity (Roadblock/LC7/MglB family)
MAAVRRSGESHERIGFKPSAAPADVEQKRPDHDGRETRCQMPDPANRSQRLDRAIADLLTQAPEVEAAAVVSFDGLPMASALPATMDEDRVAAMSAALLSLGERAAEGLGRGQLNQVYIEGDTGTVFLVSADDEAVLVAVASKGAKVGMMLYEVRRSAAAVAEALRADDAAMVAAQPSVPAVEAPVVTAADSPALQTVAPAAAGPAPAAPYAASPTDPAWVSRLPESPSGADAQPWT